MKIGDRVQWTVDALRSIGAYPNGRACRARATVVEPDLGGLDPARFITVLWEGDERPVNAARAGLELAGRPNVEGHIQRPEQWRSDLGPRPKRKRPAARRRAK